MTDRVAKQMHHRIFKSLEHNPVCPYTGPAQPEVDLLFFNLGQVPHHLSEAFKQVFRRSHTSAPYIALQLLGRPPRAPDATLLQQARRARLLGQ